MDQRPPSPGNVCVHDDAVDADTAQCVVCASDYQHQTEVLTPDQT